MAIAADTAPRRTRTSADRQFVTVKDLARYDQSNYRDPHPTVWATSTVMRDGWEVVSYQRDVTRATTRDGVEYVARIEQSAAPDSHVEFIHDFSGPIRMRDISSCIGSDSVELHNLMSMAQWKMEPFGLHPRRARLRPGVLELLAERFEVTGDVELAARLKVTPFALTLARSGFDPHGGLTSQSVASRVVDALGDLGLCESRWGRAYKLALAQ